MEKGKNIIETMMKDGLGSAIDSRRESYLKQLEAYQNLNEDVNFSSQKFLQLELSEEQRKIIEVYIENIEKQYQLIADHSYMLGFRDGIQFENSIKWFFK